MTKINIFFQVLIKRDHQKLYVYNNISDLKNKFISKFELMIIIYLYLLFRLMSYLMYFFREN